MTNPVKTERRGAVLEITLDRPPVNAINRAVSRALYDAFATLRDDPDLMVGIVTGGGDRIFSAGWDLKEVAAADFDLDLEYDPEHGNGPGGFAGNTEMFDLFKPVIAAVNGYTVGGGFELALACDLIVAVEHAEFFLPEMQRGLLADAGAIQRLPRRVPYNVAMDMLLTGRRMGAEEAARWGLVNRVVAADRLMETAREMADTIAESAPLALRALMEVMQAVETLPLPDAMAKTKRGVSGLPIYENMLASDDYFEGPRAFAEKRKPVWKGR